VKQKFKETTLLSIDSSDITNVDMKMCVIYHKTSTAVLIIHEIYVTTVQCAISV